MDGLVGKKIGMTQVFKEGGDVVPVSLIQIGPCYVIGHRTEEKDGYSAVILGYENIKKANKPHQGIFNKVKIKPLKYIFEFRTDNLEKYEIGKMVEIDLFSKGEMVDITGWTKGRGFQGVVKRFNFSGGPSGHGSRFHRIPGSIGQHTWPGEVKKGAKLPGRMGNTQKTIKNLEIVDIDKEKSLVAVKGAVPGARGSIIIIRKRQRE